MMGRAVMHGSAPALPLDLIAQAVPRLSRHDLEALTERLIERLDELDPDSDMEPDDEDTAVDDYGCDDADQGDLENDDAHPTACMLYGVDQRIVLSPSPFGLEERFRA